MTLTIRPDPAHPAGGRAILSFAAPETAPSEVSVAVCETYGGRWLAPSAGDASGRIAVGDANWQTARHDFGPYPAQRVGDRLEIAIGPEIVNKIDGYQMIRVLAGSCEGQASWPDDVLPLAGATGLSSLRVARTMAPPPMPPTPVKPAEPVPEPTPEPPPDVTPLLDDIPPAPAAERVVPLPPAAPPTNRLSLLVGIALLLLILGAGIWAYLNSRAAEIPPAPAEPAPAAPAAEPAPEPTPEPAPEPAEETATAGPECSADALGAVGFAGLRDRLGACGAAANPDDLLGVIEDGAARGDPEALLIFGRLYDPAAEDTPIETGAGLTLPDDPALAAEYYSRAKALGAAEAGPLLQAVCARLQAAGDTLSQGAHDDFCR